VSKCIFLIRKDAIYNDDPTRHYQFPKMYLGRAAQCVGDWIIYMEPAKAGNRGYHAVAKVFNVIPDPAHNGMYLALIEPGTYLEFGCDVPFRHQGQVVERGLLNDDGRVNNGRAVWAVRPLSNADFNRILELGGVAEDDELLPRIDETVAELSLVAEDHAEFEPTPRERALLLTNRKVRDRLFRRRVLEAYDCRCALTGMKLINGGGRAETEAAHIMSVEADGPDVVTNGIALSGTVHWMFDRGLVSLSDAGEILLSSRINDIDGVTKMIYADRRARFPEGLRRPHPRYLVWHRENCFNG
jgi:putative restriction endonuclease